MPFAHGPRRRHVAAAAVTCGVLAAPARALRWLAPPLLWSALLALGTLYLLFRALSRSECEKPRRAAARRFAFLARHRYAAARRSLHAVDAPHSPAILHSPAVSAALRHLFDLAIAHFVDSWFRSVSASTLFQDSVRVELRHVAATLHRRLAAVDAPRFLVFRVLPLVTDHYTHFVRAPPAPAAPHAPESKLKSARSFRGGKLHRGVSLASGAGSGTCEKAYLREKMSRVLPLLLSAHERSNAVVVALLREILACTVLTNVFDVLSEDDFFNQMVVRFIGSSLQRRTQVRRLREALSEHTKNPAAAASSPAAASPTAPHAKAAGAELQAKSELAQKPEFASLESILAEPHYAAIFREFLRGFKHEAELDLWAEIDLMKAPLEDTDAAHVALQLEFSNKDDILRIHKNYFCNPTIPLRARIHRSVQAFVDAPATDPDLYRSARAALLELQTDVLHHMEKEFFPRFCRSSRFGDLATAKPKASANGRVLSMAFPRPRSSTVADNAEFSALSPGVVKAVESAFERIMESSPRQQYIESWGDDKLKEKPFLFGESTRVVSQNSNSEPGSSNRLSALFQNDSDFDSDADNDADSVTSSLQNSQLSNSEILLAAPGDLSLAEKIGVLNHDIDNLTEQNEILTSLIKKAELTNNISELKVLRRSNASLEREIYCKELQKQQYIVQENENSLFGKSKVRIQSCVFGTDENLPYVLYIIEVQKFSSEDPQEIVAGWVVARRFSQFHKLNQYLRKKCPEVSEIAFPKKSVPYLKFQKAQQIEIRKPILESYLQQLLDNPNVCSDPAFRSFLSSEHFSVGQTKSQKKPLDVLLNRFYQDVTKTPTSTRVENAEVLQNIQDMERELKQFDDINVSGNIPFVKPISDFLSMVFDLGKSSWLRGRALLVILQQVLGSTVEKTITSAVDGNFRNEEKLLDVITMVTELLFPNGQFRESPELRTKAQRAATRQEATLMLNIFMSETCSKIFGSKNTNSASSNIAEMFQNDYLNKHLLFQVLDELLDAVFPELQS